ncbi:uncharacterized protein BDW43DRAFT_276987 [Aspergillus alliaceus]|uniref:uncharacterized protein n=1 Tax=Petromyces alliaceus TaxID=209559 RepID=UPI0012A5E0AB|nr:uncharacterized protein BDW43DRAFT_276987 [Aspergillus alliaceus]KAB8233320.1 hypothetical protein BDW43DRAFT_276987 [Aspergillus alliaceus]
MAPNNISATPAHIPPFASPLAPYIKTRQEALRIRQALTSYLRSQLTFADDDPDHPNSHAQSHLSLCVPQDAVIDVKPIPSELTGLRKEYLQALQANLNAKKEYRAVSERHISRVSQGGDTAGVGTRAVDPNTELKAYLRLLRDRRRHAKLQITEHYFEELKTRNSIKPEDFDNTGSRSKQFALPTDLKEGQNDSSSGDEIESLLHNLERAVVRARSQLDREKSLLEELRAQHETGNGPGNDGVLPGVKVAALQQTRDALVQWVEEKLMSVGSNEEGLMQEIPPEEIEKSDHLLEIQKAQVAEQYAAYVDARKRLLDAASRACQPVGTISEQPASHPTKQSKATPEETSSLEPVELLSFVDDFLLPLSKCQRALALQKFYLAGILAKEKSTTLRMLNRLSDESHLLPEYPILARHATIPTEPTKPDEVVALAEAWAFASEAAGMNEREYVKQTIEEGIETAQDAEKVLREVYDVLNQDLEEVLRDQGKEGRTDIWAHEAQSSKSRMRPGGNGKRAKGPWARLDGRIGVTD